MTAVGAEARVAPRVATERAGPRGMGSLPLHLARRPCHPSEPAVHRRLPRPTSRARARRRGLSPRPVRDLRLRRHRRLRLPRTTDDADDDDADDDDGDDD